MRWFEVFIKSAREQLRDYWILILTLIFAPFMLMMYYLMVETENPGCRVVFVNKDRGTYFLNQPINLGDTLVHYMRIITEEKELSFLNIGQEAEMEKAETSLRSGSADVLVILPDNFTLSLMTRGEHDSIRAMVELVGDVTDMDYMVGGVWTQELISQFVQHTTGILLPVGWKETTLGYSGQRSEFELYVPGLLILSIIMMMFSASAAIVREPETKTMDRLKITKLTSLEFLTGISIVQILIAAMALALALLTAVGLGYRLIPGTLWYIFFIAFLTSLSSSGMSPITSSVRRQVKFSKLLLPLLNTDLTLGDSSIRWPYPALLITPSTRGLWSSDLSYLFFLFLL